MLTDLDQSIRNLLDDFAGLPGDVGVSFAAPTKDKLSEQFVGPTNYIVNIYLYKISENLGLRETEWKEERRPEGTIVLRPPIPQINCSYVITAWSKDTSDPDHITNEHNLLSLVMPVLLSYQELPQSVLAGSLVNKVVPTAALLSDDVKSPGEFWTALENYLKPFLHYVVTIPVEPVQPITAREMVTVITERGIVKNPPGAMGPEKHMIGGWVFRLVSSVKTAVGEAQVTITEVVDAGGTPVAGGLVRTRNADKEGYFVFPNLPPGWYSFTVDATVDLGGTPTPFEAAALTTRVVPPVAPDQDHGGPARLYEVQVEPA